MAIFLFAALPAFAQGASAPANAADAAPTGLADWVIKWPWLSTVIMVIGVLRVIAKPIMTLIESTVKATPSSADDAAWAKVYASLPFTWFCWLLNYTASIKIGTEKAVPLETAPDLVVKGATPPSKFAPVNPTILPLILCLLLPAGAITACKSPEQGAYRIVGSTVTLVDTTMNIWGDYVRAGKATDAQQAQVKALYETYQAAMRTVKAAVLSLKTTSTTDQATWLNVTQAMDAAANDLVILINKLTQKDLITLIDKLELEQAALSK
jgi:hypothetical protein